MYRVFPLQTFLKYLRRCFKQPHILLLFLVVGYNLPLSYIILRFLYLGFLEFLCASLPFCGGVFCQGISRLPLAKREMSGKKEMLVTILFPCITQHYWLAFLFYPSILLFLFSVKREKVSGYFRPSYYYAHAPLLRLLLAKREMNGKKQISLGKKGLVSYI